MTDARNAYDDWHAHLGVEPASASPWHDLVRQHLVAERDLGGRRVLEIACGRGGFACWLAAQHPRPQRLVAADFSRTAVAMGAAFAKSRGIAGIDWEVADLMRIPHADATFDTVVSCETIEHVPDPRRAARELARVLVPGGRLFLTTPNYLGPVGLYRAYLWVLRRPYSETGQPINHLTLLPRTIGWLRRAGFVIRAVDGVGHHMLFPGRVPIQIPVLDRVRPITRWFGLQSLVVAERRGS